MKRSEVWNEIANIIHDTRRATLEYTSEDISDMILKYIEDIGMIPPSYITKDPGHFPGDGFEYEVNEWEDET